MSPKQPTSAEERERMIAEAAYFRAMERNFAGEDALTDWLSAEREIDAKFSVASHDRVTARLHERLADANARIHDLATKLKREAREEWAEEFDRVHELRGVLAQNLEEVRERTGEAKRKALRQADKVWKDLVTALNRMGEYHLEAGSSTAQGSGARSSEDRHESGS